LECTKEELLEGMRDRTLPGGAVHVLRADSVAEANEIMKRVRDYKVPPDLTARPFGG